MERLSLWRTRIYDFKSGCEIFTCLADILWNFETLIATINFFSRPLVNKIFNLGYSNGEIRECKDDGNMIFVIENSEYIPSHT